MKTIFRFLWAGICLLFASSAFSQGRVQFSNNTATALTNCVNLLQPAPRTLKIGLYFTPNLSAVSNEAALSSMTLVGITTNAPNAGGFFNGGIVTLPGVPISSSVVLQIKVWPTNYTSFEAAVEAGADVAVSLPWVQATGGSINPPTMLARWGLRPMLIPECKPRRVPLIVEKGDGKIRVFWPIGLPPTVQMNDGLSTNWVTLTSGTFVTDHWELEAPMSGGARNCSSPSA